MPGWVVRYPVSRPVPAKAGSSAAGYRSFLQGADVGADRVQRPGDDQGVDVVVAGGFALLLDLAINSHGSWWSLSVLL